VLIPAMEWGNDEKGLALIYGPMTFPEPPHDAPHAQMVANRVQAQGGVYVVARPCFPTSPWQWGVSFVNAIEVWCRDWRGVPPMHPEQLDESFMVREGGKLVFSIATAASTTGVSANGQATLFWDYELARGLRAAAVASSGTGAPSVRMAAPVTYVYAKQKSAAGILAGLRGGRTYLSAGLDGPRVRFLADILADGKVDETVGGVIPCRVKVRFVIAIEGAKGAKLQVLRDGYPVITKVIENDTFVHQFDVTHENPTAYRVQVIETPQEQGFGPYDMLAMTSPIYVADILPDIIAQQQADARAAAEARAQAGIE